MILLKQIPQRAVINNQGKKDEPEDPEPDWPAVQAAHLPAAQCHGARETLYSMTFFFSYRNSYVTRPPGQCRRKLADVNVVSRGRNQCHARKNHVKSNKNTTPGPKTQLERIYEDKSRSGWNMFFFPNTSNAWGVRQRKGHVLDLLCPEHVNNANNNSGLNYL